MGGRVSKSGGGTPPSTPQWHADGPPRAPTSASVVRASVPGLEPNSARRQASAGDGAPRTALTPRVRAAHSSREGHSVHSHPSIGQFNVQANPIAPGSGEMRFDLALETPTGQRVETQHYMNYSPSDPAHGGHSSLSFGDIELPKEMQGKGLGTMYLAAAAKEAKRLGVELLAIDNVVSKAMHTLCNRAGMTQRFVPGFYELDPDTLVRNCEDRATSKGWQ